VERDGPHASAVAPVTFVTPALRDQASDNSVWNREVFVLSLFLEMAVLWISVSLLGGVLWVLLVRLLDASRKKGRTVTQLKSTRHIFDYGPIN
jgi:hypothetical protein